MCLGQLGFHSPAAPLQVSSHMQHEAKGTSGRYSLYRQSWAVRWVWSTDPRNLALPSLCPERGLLVRSFVSMVKEYREPSEQLSERERQFPPTTHAGESQRRVKFMIRPVLAQEVRSLRKEGRFSLSTHLNHWLPRQPESEKLHPACHTAPGSDPQGSLPSPL